MEDFFRKFSLFEDFSDSDLKKVIKLVKSLELPAGEVLIKQGETGENLYFLKKGELEVNISGHFIDSRTPPCVMGEMEIFDKKPNIANVLANSDSYLYYITFDEFQEFLNINPTIYRKLVILIISKWRNVEYGTRNIIKTMSENNKNLSEFAYIVSHDLKSPLQTITMYTELLKSESGDELKKTSIDYLNRINTSIKKMDQLIEGILKYSKAIHSSQDDFNEINVKDIIKDVIFMLSIDDDVKITIKDPVPIIRSNKIQITQIFQNLINNALKHFDKPEKTISIECKSLPKFWKFSVKDNGIGIKKEDFTRVMQIFQSINNTGKKKGTGIGLAIVQRIILLHGGKIWIESEFGKGTTFHFTISKSLI